MSIGTNDRIDNRHILAATTVMDEYSFYLDYVCWLYKLSTEA